MTFPADLPAQSPAPSPPGTAAPWFDDYRAALLGDTPDPAIGESRKRIGIPPTAESDSPPLRIRPPRPTLGPVKLLLPRPHPREAPPRDLCRGRSGSLPARQVARHSPVPGRGVPETSAGSGSHDSSKRRSSGDHAKPQHVRCGHAAFAASDGAERGHRARRNTRCL